MLHQILRSRYVRHLVYLLCGLMVLGGQPLMALEQNVRIVPKDEQPEWLEPWLDETTYADAWDGAVVWSRDAIGDIHRHLDSWWDGTWEDAWDSLDAAHSVLEVPQYASVLPAAAMVASQPEPAPLQPEAMPRERASSSISGQSSFLPIRRVERKALSEKLSGSRQISASSAVATPSVPRQKISKNGIAPEIVALAESFGNSPAEIFAFVHDEIDFDPKFGATKSALGTLFERRGTAWDQAWLLQELLTAAGVDARFEWGEIQISVELLRSITGVEDPWRAADLMTTAGTPIVVLVEGSQVVSAQMTHPWVKAYLDYIPNRGVTPGPGDTWIRMDPSLKRYEVESGLRLDDEVSFSLESYLLSGTEQSPREVYEEALWSYVSSNGLGASDLADLKPERTLIREAFPMVPAASRARILSVAGESTTVPEALQLRLRIEVRESQGSVIASYETPWPTVYGRRLDLAWPGATSSDQSTLDLYGGVFATPPYEVDLRPSIRVEGVEVATGSHIGSAEDVDLWLTWLTPDGLETVVPFDMWAGESGVLSADFGATPQETLDRYALEQSGATEPTEQESWSLALAAARYQRSLGAELGHLADLNWHRAVNLGRTVLAVQKGAVSASPGGTPLTFSRGPVALDLGLMSLGLFPAEGGQISTKSTLELLGAQGSFQEATALSGVFEGDHVSGVTFLTRAVRDGQTLTRVDASNVSEALADVQLSYEAESAVEQGIAQGLIAWIPEDQLLIDTFDATGYVLEDSTTGAAGFFVTYERLVQELEATVQFDAPTDLDVVTQPTDIVASIEGDDVVQWTLSYQRTGEGPTQVLATGSGPVSQETIAQFDPTLLINGLYDLVLTATGSIGQTKSEKISVVVEGNMKIGHFTLSFIDLAIPLSGFDLEIIRTYDSRRKDELLDFGYGWSLETNQFTVQETTPPGLGWRGVAYPFSFDQYCIESDETHLITVTFPDGDVARFQPVFEPQCQAFIPPQVVTVHYQPLSGTFADLEHVGLASQELLVIGSFPGPISFYDPDLGEPYDPDTYQLVAPDGTRIDVSEDERLRKIEDLNGNFLAITPEGIESSSGLEIQLERDELGRISRITDPLGNSMEYEYDPSDDLARVKDRAGAETQLSYREHYLEDIYNAAGVRAVRSEYDDSGRLVRHIDASGQVFELTHDLEQRREIVTNRLGHSRLLEYDARGNVVREVDEEGGVTVRTFDGYDNVLTETDALGRVTTYAYTADNELATMTNALGETTSLTYNDRGQVLNVTGPDGLVTTSTYDDAGNLETTTDALGQVTTFTYDYAGNLRTIVDSLGHVTEMTYNSRGDVLTEMDPLGHVSTYTYDGHGNQITSSRTRTLPDDSTETLTTTFVYDELDRVVSTTAPDGTVTSTTYDALGRVASQTDALGRVTRLDYDALGQLRSTTLPDGTIQSQTYDAEGRMLTRTDRGGPVTQMTYDAVGRLLQSTFADGAAHSQTYDAAGQMVAATDARGNTTTYAYDDAGRRLSVTNALDQTTSFAYDTAGNQTAVTDARGHTTEFAYDELNRLVTTTFADGTTTHVGYDALGRRVSETDQAGITTHFDYDALGRLTSVTDALDQVTSYTYDELGNRLTQTDVNGNTTSFEYDRLGRQTTRILPDDARESMTYNADGTLASHTAFNGDTRIFEYDENQRLVRRAYPDGSEHLFSYTAAGQRETATDSRGVTSYAYDVRDRLLEKQDPNGHRLTYTYDVQGNLETLTAAVGTESYTTSYAYDALNRQVTVTDPQGGVNALSYDVNGNRASLTHANGLVTSYDYDPLNRLELLETVNTASDVLQRYSYTLEPTGHRAQIAEVDGTTRSYDYDDLYRLTQDQVTDGAGELVYQHDFVYDPVGNRLSQTIEEGAGPTVETSTHDERDRLLSAASTSYGWNENGSLTTRGSERFKWDFDQRLTSVTLDDGTIIETAYDSDGNRQQATIAASDGTGTTVHYLIDPRPGLSQVIAEVVNGSVEIVYTRSNDELISAHRPQNEQQIYYHSDALGSVRALTDQQGDATDRYAYSAFGVEIEHLGADSQPYRFAGEPFSQALGLQFHRARWLDPLRGRFVSMDPFPGGTSRTKTLHRYLYADVDPLNNVDPTGLFTSTVSFSVANAVRGIVTSIQVDVGINILTQPPLDPDGKISKTLLIASLASGGYALLRNRQALLRSIKQFGTGIGQSTKRLFRRFADWARRADMSWPNGIPPSEGFGITTDLRQALSLKKRNVAVAEVHVDGRNEILLAISGEASPPGTVTAPVAPKFSTRPKGAQTSAFDTEVKILEEIAASLPPNASGRISLFTEKPPCFSCSFENPPGVIQQFEQAFPGIRVIVTHGGG